MNSSPNTKASGRIYALQAHPAAIVAVDPDSGGAETVLSICSGTPDGIQLDGAGNAIYWTNMGAMPSSGEAFPDRDGTIERCDLNGRNHRVLVSDGAIVTPKQMQLSTRQKVLFWCDREGMKIDCCRTDGSALTTLLSTGSWPADTNDVLRHCVGIAIDESHHHLYWTQKGPPDGGQGRIFRMGLKMPEGAQPEKRYDVELLLEKLPEPIDLEIDHAGRQLYWTDRGDPTVGGNTLNRADITAGGLANHQIMASGLKEGIGLALDIEGRRAFVADLSGSIRMVSMDGGAFTTIHKCQGPVTGLAFLPEVAAQIRTVG
ncbi:hypothetical protein WL99_12465 [Burkholderia cepacia]|uniref:hypothetical protein n=1 Tax=Burkholderia cepacia TaxID=292 RepID=UPI00075DEFBD|nr:hypothetical protein [Burkholderia cepacia]KWH31893.1 hypothetical protein WL99_12465 [Burkholderia cepacia]